LLDSRRFTTRRFGPRRFGPRRFGPRRLGARLGSLDRPPLGLAIHTPLRSPIGAPLGLPLTAAATAFALLGERRRRKDDRHGKRGRQGERQGPFHVLSSDTAIQRKLLANWTGEICWSFTQSQDRLAHPEDDELFLLL
jgi:hypothetical protein